MCTSLAQCIKRLRDSKFKRSDDHRLNDSSLGQKINVSKQKSKRKIKQSADARKIEKSKRCGSRSFHYKMTDTTKKSQSDNKKERRRCQKIAFSCDRCPFAEEADYQGSHPPWTKKSVRFPSDTFLLRDPFQPLGLHFLVLGGSCSIPDCAAHQICQDCSLVYAGKRLCLGCAQSPDYFQQFPNEIQAKIVKKLDANKISKDKK